MPIHDIKTIKTSIGSIDVHGGVLRGGRGGSVRPEAAGGVVPGLDDVVRQPNGRCAARDVFHPRPEFVIWLAEIVALSEKVTELHRNLEVGRELRPEKRLASRRGDLAIATGWFIAQAQANRDTTAVYFGRNVQFVLLGGDFIRRDLNDWVSAELNLEIPC